MSNMRMIDSNKLRERMHEEYRKLHAEYHKTDFPPLRDIYKGKLNMLMTCLDMVREAPSIAVMERGKWEFDTIEMEYYCPKCGNSATIGVSSYILSNYCPNCGARMDGE